ncbi:hypothetical protein N7U49_17330 [Streptomyces sp. AD2-2]|nr:hypothetical protein N7U49_17330 [Streptomyces sp. AD2-2]
MTVKPPTPAGTTPLKGRGELRDQPPRPGTQKPTDATQIPAQPPHRNTPPPPTPAASSPKPP